MTQKNVKVFCILSIIVFLIFNFLNVELLDAVSYAATIAAVIDLAYDRFLWRINPFEKTPRLYGIYKASLCSSFNSGTTYIGKVTIKQTLTSVTILEESENGYCESVTATLSQSTPHGLWTLYYTYLTHPKKSPQSKHKDDMHYGSCVLFVKNRDLLEGGYYTDRINQTSGSAKFERWSS